MHVSIPVEFWKMLHNLITSSQIVIDRPMGSAHPRYPDMIYPLDYGYLSDTTSSDGDQVDVWMGSLQPHNLTGVVCTVDMQDRDVEIKLLLGCNEEEIKIILYIHNQGTQRAFFIPRQEPCI
ncbi:MAG: inorganic pyrophosphatase [Anaerolineae bacterium]|nr:inorganic pyrophosphatase [Anaerolineae bacterium]